MDSQADDGRAPHVQLLEHLSGLLEQVATLHGAMHGALKRGDSAAIESATSQLETLALEFKVLEAEHRRLPAGEGEPGLAEARARFQETATRLARSAAVSGGLLERLVTMSRRLHSALGSARGETYLPTGQTREPSLEGLRLRERA